MKKSLFALAALSAFATTAQAQSSVTLFGNLDATFVHDAGNGAASNGLVSAANTTSVWGLTGSEDLGGGQKLGFNLVSELNLATGMTGSGTNTPNTAVLVTAPAATAPQPTGGTSNLFNRGANITFTDAKMGEVRIGRMDDIEWAMSGSFSTSNSNSFGSNQAHAQMANIKGLGLGTACATPSIGVAGNGVCSVAAMTVTQLNASSYQGSADAFMTGIQWSTPEVYGFSAKVQTSMGPQAGTLAAGPGFYDSGMQGIGLKYDGIQGLNLGASTARRMDETGSLASTFTTFGAKYAVTPAITVTGNYSTSQFVNASINGATSNLPTAGGAGVAGALAAPTGLAGNNMYSFGVNYKVNANADVSLAYTNIASDTFSANSVTMYGLTGRYNLSKRTQMYAGIGEAINSGGYAMSPIYGGSSYVTAASSNGTANASTGGTIWGAMLGLKHTF